jgi:dienelactone hydrolase
LSALIRRFVVLPLLAAAFLASVAAAVTHAERLTRTELLRGYVEFSEPPQGERAPLVILMSGCGGITGLDGPKPVMRRYAEAAVEAGAYAVVVDSFGARDIGYLSAISTVCPGVRLRGRARAGDILAAEAIARERWGDSISGVILAGWSHGGWSIMELLASSPDARWLDDIGADGPFDALEPEAVALFYPYCGRLNSARRRAWAFDGPMLHVSAGRDRSIGPKARCEKIIAHARGDLEGVVSLYFHDATHAFDEEGGSIRPDFVYDAELAAEAEEAFATFITEHGGESATAADAPLSAAIPRP